MLDRTLGRPKPVRAGAAVGGPPASIQSRSRASPLVRQVTASVPASVDSAPYLAALVASSCSAKATACAVAGSRTTAGPLAITRRRRLAVLGAILSSTLLARTA